MKYTFRFLSLILLTAALFACVEKEQPSGDDQTVPGEEESGTGEYTYIFSLAADKIKSSFGTDHIAWEAGDQVASYASASKNKATDVEINGDKVTITIRSSVALSAGDKVYAYAPYSSANNNKEASALTLEIPASQICGSADAMPMVSVPFELTGNVASYTNTNVGTLQFLNLGSVIKLNIYKSKGFLAGEKIENVTFKAGAPCAGSFTYDLTSVNAASPAAISGYNEQEVLLTVGSNSVTVGSSEENGGELYIVVAPGTYGGSFVIRTSEGDYTYVSSTNRTYARASLKPLNIDLSSTNWIPAEGYDNSIDSPRELAQFLAGTSASDTGSYSISADLDMSGYTIVSASGFGGTLDGGEHTIKNLTASVPLFATNSGTIKNLFFDESCVFNAGSNVFGPLVAEDKGGTYNTVRNKAAVNYTSSGNVSTPLMIGGLIGSADGAKLTSCTNGGAVTIEATGYSHKAVGLGGIVGASLAITLDACINRGPITLNADYGDPKNPLIAGAGDDSPDNRGINIGGILGYGYDAGKAKYCTFISCENQSSGVVTLKHTKINSITGNTTSSYLGIGGIVGRARGNMTSCKNFAPIDVTATTSDRSGVKLQNYCVNVGGIAGVGRWSISFESCRNDGNINVVYDGTYNGNRNRSTIGGICGWQDYDGEHVVSNQADLFAYYCNQRGSITANGSGILCIGGIFGFSGKQIGNKVYNSCTISYRGPQGYVGGLVGSVEDNPTYYTIKNCSCAATIVAEDSDSKDDEYFNVGGFIGKWGRDSSKEESWSCLTDRNNSPCSFTGSVSSTTVSRVGIAVGYIVASSPNQKLTFGSTSFSIQASGTYGKKDLPATTIHAGNVASYAIGANKGATVNMYIGSPTPAPIPAANLTLMSFNIKSADSFKDRNSAIVSMIKGESPDIIGLQEVNDLDGLDLYTEAGGTQPWNYLKNNLSAYSNYRSGSKTNAILYKSSTVELSNIGLFYLGKDYNTSGKSNSWDDYERTAIYATVKEKASGRYFFLLTTHYPLNQTGQTNATELVESRIAALNTNNYPVILMGDFNCVYGNTCWDNVKTWMYNTRYAPNVSVYSADNQNLYTYNAFGDSSKDRNKVDHIWVSKSIKVDSYLTLTQDIRKYGSVSFLSDHYPIIAHIS